MSARKTCGALVAMKGSSALDEVNEARSDLESWGAGAVEVFTVGESVIDPPTTVVRVEAGRPSRLGWDLDQVRTNPPRRTQRKGRRR